MTEKQPGFQEEDRENLRRWLAIGKDNIWITEATDPPFTVDSFYKCRDREELAERLTATNWCLGQAYHYQDLCFINQVDGGDEWLTIRYGFAFESMSFNAIEAQHGRDGVLAIIDRLLVASPEQCRNLEY